MKPLLASAKSMVATVKAAVAPKRKVDPWSNDSARQAEVNAEGGRLRSERERSINAAFGLRGGWLGSTKGWLKR
jgi:hypothetical protein